MSNAPANPQQRQIFLANNNLRLRQCRYGPMLYLANDTYIGRSFETYGEMNEFEVQVQRALFAPGDVMLDVGANIGANTVPLAQHAGPSGHIIAFEPQRILHQMLCANLSLNSLPNVTALWSAVGAQPGEIRVPPINYSASGNFGGVELGGEQGERVSVVTIDDLSLDRCRLIKIDVEGMELEVLRGAANTLARCQPRLFFENNRQAKSAPVLSYLLGLDYRLYWHITPLFNPQNFTGQPHNLWPNTVSIDVLALPAGDPTIVQDGRQITSPDDWWQRPPSADASGKS